MAQKLEDCPFCGSEDIQIDINQDNEIHYSVVYGDNEKKHYFCRCNKCRCHYGYGTKQQAIDAWNTRPTPQKELVELDAIDTVELDNVIQSVLNKEFALDVTHYEVAVMRNDMIKWFSKFAAPKEDKKPI